MRHVNIKIIDNNSYLVYQRNTIFAMVGISTMNGSWSLECKIVRAFQILRREIGELRGIERMKDKLSFKSKNHILELLKSRRRSNAKLCFQDKKPIGYAKHVGIEIEFISNSKRDAIALDLAVMGIEKHCHLKSDGSVQGDSDDDGRECDGSCRDNCDCANCGNRHYCDDKSQCNDRTGNSPSRWVIRDNCPDCEETVILDDCNCGGEDLAGTPTCDGDHVICLGHCNSHACGGYDDHEDYDCNCECNCSGNPDSGHEIAVVAKSEDIKEVLTKVCNVLKKHNATVNDTCGLHIHLDARRQNKDAMFNNLVNSQRLLYSMVPRSRFTNTFCKPNDYLLPMCEYDDRYFGVNPQSYKKYKTIEIRLHSGTVNAEKILNFVELLQKIGYSKTHVNMVEYLTDLTNVVNLSDSLLSYVTERVNKFKDQHKTYSIPLTRPMIQLELKNSIETYLTIAA